MFTGLVEEIGQVAQVQHGEEALHFTIAAPKVCSDLAVGDSVCVNGVCLTATSVAAGRFTAVAMRETVNRTTLGKTAPGSNVNLERALRLGDRLGGHLVLGHVDGTGVVKAIGREGSAQRVEIDTDPALMPYLVPKGSITVDGVSLTIVDCMESSFTIALIPHTRRVTALSRLQPGVMVNLETDIIGKYVSRLLRQRGLLPTERGAAPAEDDLPQNGVSLEQLRRFGFA